MSFEGTSTSSPVSSASTEKEFCIPLDIILHVSKYLEFKDYHSFVRAFWPDGDEVEEVRAKLWKLSTHQVTTDFLNGQPISVTFNYNPWRTDGEPLLIDLKTLSGIFGGIGTESVDQFASVQTLDNFIVDHVHMDGCLELHYADCLCHLGHRAKLRGRTVPKSPADPCPDGCFHHYCSQHVTYWLYVCLLPDIYNSTAYSTCRWFRTIVYHSVTVDRTICTYVSPTFM